MEVARAAPGGLQHWHPAAPRARPIPQPVPQLRALTEHPPIHRWPTPASPQSALEGAGDLAGATTRTASSAKSAASAMQPCSVLTGPRSERPLRLVSHNGSRHFATSRETGNVGAGSDSDERLLFLRAGATGTYRYVASSDGFDRVVVKGEGTGVLELWIGGLHVTDVQIERGEGGTEFDRLPIGIDEISLTSHGIGACRRVPSPSRSRSTNHEPESETGEKCSTAHQHLAGPSTAPADGGCSKPSFRASLRLRAAQNGRLTRACGVTTVRDCGERNRHRAGKSGRSRPRRRAANRRSRPGHHHDQRAAAYNFITAAVQGLGESTDDRERMDVKFALVARGTD